jgi:putative SOS response-associated peptidase YedK
MCGRYAAAKDTDRLVEQFAVEEVVEPAPPANFNVAPTAVVPMIVAAQEDNRRQLRQARWGLVPPWSKDMKSAARMINARWESLADRPAFRVPFARRRAILPADGYFEWFRPAGSKTAKQPYFIHGASAESLAMAALFDFWRPTPDASPVVSVAVITTAAEGPLARLHDRMPLLLPVELFHPWLDRHAAFDTSLLADPKVVRVGLAAHPVGRAVNAVSNNGPQLLEPVTPVSGPDLGELGEPTGSP